MIDIEKKIKDFADNIIKLKAVNTKYLTKAQAKLIDGTDLNYTIYVKDLNGARTHCTGIYFIPYSHKKFKNIIKKIEKSFIQYGNLEITDEMIERGYYDR